MQEKVELSWIALFGGFDATTGERSEGLVQWQQRQTLVAAKLLTVLTRLGWLLLGTLALGIGNALVLWLANVLKYLGDHISALTSTVPK
jgi:hypothetical protein